MQIRSHRTVVVAGALAAALALGACGDDAPIAPQQDPNGNGQNDPEPQSVPAPSGEGEWNDIAIPDSLLGTDTPLDLDWLTLLIPGDYGEVSPVHEDYLYASENGSSFISVSDNSSPTFASDGESAWEDAIDYYSETYSHDDLHYEEVTDAPQGTRAWTVTGYGNDVREHDIVIEHAATGDMVYLMYGAFSDELLVPQFLLDTVTVNQ